MTESRHVLRKYYSEISDVVAIFPDLLLSLSNRFYQQELIDVLTKAEINREGGLKGASTLLDHVMIKIKNSDHHLPEVMKILGEAVELKETARKMDYIIRMNQDRGHDVGIVPEWCYQTLSFLEYEIPPAYRTIEHFNKHKENDELVTTDPFHIGSNKGYKMALDVYPNGHGSGEGTHISVFINLMKGPNDDNLPFPIPDIVFTVQMLNWRKNEAHIEKIIEFDKDTPMECRERVVKEAPGNDGGANRKKDQLVGHEEFLPHNDLCNDSPYLHQDMISFKIDFSSSSQIGDNDPKGQPTSTSIPSSSMTSMVNGVGVDASSTNHDPQEIETNTVIGVSETIHVNLKSLNKKYKDLMFKLQKHFKQLVNDPATKVEIIDDLKDRLEMEEAFYKNCNIANVTSVDQIFAKLKSPDCCCFFLDPDILVVIADFLEDYNPELHLKVMSYVNEVNSFKKTEPLANLKNQLAPLIGLHCTRLKEGTVKIQFKLQNAFGPTPMQLFEVLLKMIYDLKMPYKWYEIENGSIIISLISLRQFAKSFTDYCQLEQREFLSLVGVFSISVDGKEMLNESTGIEKPGYTFESALLKATALGNIKAIQFLVKACTYVNRDAKKIESAIIIATEQMNIEAVKCLVDVKYNVDSVNTKKKSPLIIACESGCNELAEVLLDAKANVNHQDSVGNTALHYTSVHKNVSLSLTLVKFGADPLIANSRSETPLMLAVDNNMHEVVNSFIPNVSSQSQLCLAFLLACRHGYLSVIVSLVDCLKSKYNFDFSLTLVFAKGDVSSVSSLPKEDLKCAIYKGVTPLMIASSCGNTQVVSYLINAEVEINCFDEEGFTPLVYAANGRSVEIMEYLLKAKSNPFVKIGHTGDSQFLIQNQLIAFNHDEVKREQVVLLIRYAALHLHECFTSLVKIMESDITKSVLQMKRPSIGDCLNKLFKSPEHAFNHIPLLVMAENPDQLFTCIRPFHDFLSWKLISSLSNCLKENKYFPLVCVFETNTKLCMFSEVTTLIPRPTVVSSPVTTNLHIEFNREWNNRPLIDLRYVVNYLLDPSHSDALSCLTIAPSHDGVLVEYRIPKSLELTDKIIQFVRKLRVSAAILGVIKIVVDSVHVPKIDQCHSFSFESTVLNAVMHSEEMNHKELPKLLKLLLAKLKIDPNFKALGTTALHNVIESANLEALEILLENSASLDLENDSGATALSLASSLATSEEYIEVVTALYRKVLSIDHQSGPACRTRNLTRNLNRQFIDEIRSKVDSRYLVTSLQMRQLADHDDSQMTHMLSRALIDACDNGAIEEVKSLLEKGVDPNALNGIAPFTALMLASFRGRTEIVKLLLQHNADHSCLRKSKEGLRLFDAFALACYSGNLETVNAYFNADAIILQPRQLYFGWYISCLYNRPNIAEHLLEYLAEISVEQRDLIKACYRNDANYIRNIDTRIANARIPIMFGITPLMIACSCDSYEVANVLLRTHGSRADEEDDFGFQPCTFCEDESPILIVLDKKDPRFDPFINKHMIILQPHDAAAEDSDDDDDDALDDS